MQQQQDQYSPSILQMQHQYFGGEIEVQYQFYEKKISKFYDTGSKERRHTELLKY